MKNENKIPLSEKSKIKSKSQKEEKSLPLTHKYMTPNTQIHDSSLFWFDTGTFINSVVIELVLGAHTSFLGEVMNVM